MISEIIVPDLGATGGDVILEEWFIKPGERVQAGQPLFSVTTDKATVVVEAFRAGVVREILREAGEKVPLGAVVALLADSTDRLGRQPASEIEPASTSLATSSQASHPAGLEKPGRILASPLARRMAEASGLELETLSGTGRQGQVLKRDVLRALERREHRPPGEPPDALAEGAVRREPLSPMRRAIAERTSQSKGTIPHFYADITVAMGQARELLREAADWAAKHGWTKPSITDLCLRATALCLQEFPALNASFQGDAIAYHQEINIGMVVGLEDGLLIPVIHGADRRNLYMLAAETQRLRVQADAGQLRAHDLVGATFTLSNLGMFGLDRFQAVINPPQAGILALGAAQERPAVVDGVILPLPQMQVTLSGDHRVVDGIVAARFLAAFKDLLENPVRLTFTAPEETG